ncbi:hypothetical protein PG996_008091 [Apiospora saccharicola]|uniref:Uncharacterized protein n=1 Tax=Apiospora saccharicola TaxID=335842 RepID=A0ABR1V035_9PEZI
MYLLLLLCSLLLSARYTCGVSVAPSAIPSSIAPSPAGPNLWTITDHRIACNPAECMYSFNIAEKPNLMEPQQAPTHCEFTVDAGGGGLGSAAAAAGALPANRTSFQDKICGGEYDGEGTSNNSYTVNGGYMNTSSVVLCFTNSDEGLWAFFGFDPWEFLSGPQKTSPAYQIGWFGNNSNYTKPRLGLSRRDNLSRRDTHVWKFLSGTRVIQDYINPNKVDIKFTIQGPTGNNISCWAVLDSPSEVAAENWSFSHKGCRNSQWSFGWGYDDYQDTGVLSVFEYHT